MKTTAWLSKRLAIISQFWLVKFGNRFNKHHARKWRSPVSVGLGTCQVWWLCWEHHMVVNRQQSFWGPCKVVKASCWRRGRWCRTVASKLWCQGVDHILVIVFCTEILHVANWASTWANQMWGSADHKGGSLMLVAAMVTGLPSAGVRNGHSSSCDMADFEASIACVRVINYRMWK